MCKLMVAMPCSPCRWSRACPQEWQGRQGCRLVMVAMVAELPAGVPHCPVERLECPVPRLVPAGPVCKRQLTSLILEMQKGSWLYPIAKDAPQLASWPRHQQPLGQRTGYEKLDRDREAAACRVNASTDPNAPPSDRLNDIDEASSEAPDAPCCLRRLLEPQCQLSAVGRASKLRLQAA
jgi:hypothetical protein